MQKIKTFIAGKKSYLVAMTAIVTAVSAWAADSLTTGELVASILGALALASQRAAIQKAIDAGAPKDENTGA